VAGQVGSRTGSGGESCITSGVLVSTISAFFPFSNLKKLLVEFGGNLFWLLWRRMEGEIVECEEGWGRVRVGVGRGVVDTRVVMESLTTIV